MLHRKTGLAVYPGGVQSEPPNRVFFEFLSDTSDVGGMR